MSKLTDSRGKSGVILYSTVAESDKENVGQHSNNSKKGPLPLKPPAPKVKTVLQQPTFCMNINSKMPGLIEDSDVFIMPALPTSATCQTPLMSSSQVSGNNLLSSVRSNKVKYSTQEDINVGLSLESTCHDSAGRSIAHKRSLDAVMNNINFSSDSQPNERRCSTSSKQANARCSFLKQVDLIGKKSVLSQVSKDVCLNTDASSIPDTMLPVWETLNSKAKAVIHSSTIIDNGSQSQYPLNTPHVSTTDFGNETSISPSPLCSPVQTVYHSHNLVTAPQSNNDAAAAAAAAAAASIIDETESLAASLESSLRIIDTCHQSLLSEKTDCSRSVANLPLSKVKAPNPPNNFNLRGPAMVDSLDESEKFSSDETNLNTASKTHNPRAPIYLTNDAPLVEINTKTTIPTAPLLIPTSAWTPLECQRIMNSPIKDDSFDSFIRHGGSNCITAGVVKTTVLETSSDSFIRHGGSNCITAGVVKTTVLETSSDSFIRHGGSNCITAGVVKTTVLETSSDSFIRHGGSNCITAGVVKTTVLETSSDSFIRHGGSNCITAGVVKTTVLETSSDEDGEGTPEGETKTYYVGKNNVTSEKMALKTPAKYIRNGSGTSKTGLSGSPPAGWDDYVHSESLMLRLKALSCTTGHVAKSSHSPASHSVVPASSHLPNHVPFTLGGKTGISQKELHLPKPVVTTCDVVNHGVDTPGEDQAVSNQANPVFVRRRPIVDLADSDCSDQSLPIVTPKMITTKKRKAKTSQKKLNLNNQASKLVDADTENQTLLRVGNESNMNRFSSEIKKENQYASPELRMDAKTGAGTLPNEKNKDAVNPPHTMTQKMPWSNSSDSDEVSNYMEQWRKNCEDGRTSDRSDSSGADSDSSFIVETCDEDEDDLSFYLPSLNKVLIQGEEKLSSRRDLGSISEELPDIKNPKLPTTKSSTINDPPIHEVSDSTDSVSSPEHVATFRPRTQYVCLSDSDDDTYTPPSQIRGPITPLSKPRKTGLITPLPAKTPKPAPRKTLVCPQTVEPSKSRVPSKATCSTATMNCATPTLSFLASLSAQPGSDRVHPEAVPYLKNFKKNRENLVDRLYKLFNSQCFGDELPVNMNITWNVRLTKTAGYCKYVKDLSKPNNRGARVELSTKVVDNCERLRDTLIHELCHAASWIVSGYRDGHGALFKSWGWRAIKRFPELPAISRCHNYKISCKYTYRCTKCNSSIGRHSKSLDISRKVCGRCRGPFELLVNGKSAQQGAQGVPSTPRTPAPFAMFVKENYGSVKKSATALKHAEVMKILGEQFKEMKT